MVVVFGHTGFIGHRLYRHLEESGCQPVGISSAQCDLLNPRALRSRLAELPQPFAVVNCAVLNRRRCLAPEGMQQNLRMFRNILEAVPPTACRFFIQLSSVDIYGSTPPLPITEESPLAPDTWYARAKLGCEQLLGANRLADFPSVILRLPGVYGTGDRGESTVGTLFRRAVNRKPIDLTHGGTQLRDYLLVDDLLRIIQMLLDQPRQLLVNLVSGRSRSLRDLVDMIFAQTGTGSRVSFMRQPALSPPDLVFDNSRCREYFPGFDFTDLSEGIRKYAEHYKASPVDC